MDVTVSEVDPSPTAVVAGPMDRSRFMADLDAVYAFLRGTTAVRQSGQNIALYGTGRMEVGVEVDGPFDPDGPVVASQLPGGRIAHATHTTGYTDLAATYAAITRWCEANGHALAGVQWERYGDPDEQGHVDVEVCFLLGRGGT
jgi:effector-binding domain-containing protein